MIDIATALFFIYNIYILALIILLILDNRDSRATITWIAILVLLPGIGLLIYLLIGRNWRRVSKKSKLANQEIARSVVASISALVRREAESREHLLRRVEYSRKNELFNLLKNNSNSILTSSNKVEVIQSGEEKFAKLLSDLESAEKFIHMEYFIWKNDKLGRKINEILMKKARAGVEVKIIYDTFGSFYFNRFIRRKLRKSGVKIYPYFNFLLPFKFHTLNYRNHRKIAIIDGKVAYTGGMNIGQEYIDGGKKFESWRDTHLRIRGDAVEVLQGIFAVSWYNTTREKLFDQKYYPIGKKFDEKTAVHIIPSGPDTEWDSIRQLYFALITTAERCVYIQSPYFIPDPGVDTALKVAALSGIDVRIMMTGVADHYLPFWAAHTYFEELIKAGVKIYQYKKGLMHSKTVMADGSVCSIGTANMDIRSFDLQYELNTIIYDRTIAEKLKEDFLADMKHCRQVSLHEIQNMNVFMKFRNSLARLFAPLL